MLAPGGGADPPLFELFCTGAPTFSIGCEHKRLLGDFWDEEYGFNEAGLSASVVAMHNASGKMLEIFNASQTDDGDDDLTFEMDDGIGAMMEQTKLPMHVTPDERFMEGSHTWALHFEDRALLSHYDLNRPRSAKAKLMLSRMDHSRSQSFDSPAPSSFLPELLERLLVCRASSSDEDPCSRESSSDEESDP
jgi:hypothetical protein